jgi:predicted secreted protein
LAGAGGTRLIQIRAVNPGQDVFELAYLRSWEMLEGESLEDANHSGDYYAIAISVSQ